MEDVNDNLPTEGKRYYMSHSEYFFTDEYREKNNIPDSMKYHEFKLTQLVCATNQEKAREAVIRQLEGNKTYLVTKCRIDNLIVGD